MSLPTTRVVTGLYTHPVTGLPREGSVIFAPYPAFWTDSNGNQILSGETEITLSSGSYSQALVVTTGADLYPATGKLWKYTEKISGESRRVTFFELPSGVGSIDITDLTPVDPSVPPYVPPATDAGGDLTGSYPNPQLANTADARSHLGLGNSATRPVGTTPGTVAAGDDPRFGTGSGLQPENNLSDLDNAATARTNLGLGDSAVRNVGQLANTVAAGNDGRILGALQSANNLDDLQDPATARLSLELGDSAVKNTGSGAGQVAAGDDGRITGAAQKASNLSDLTDSTAARTSLGLGNSATRSVGTSTGQVAAGDDSRIVGAAQKSANLSDLTDNSAARAALGLGSVATRAVGTTTGTAAAGDDSRFTNDRNPTAHASTHAAAGSDPVTVVQSQVTGLAASLGALLPLAGGTMTGNTNATLGSAGTTTQASLVGGDAFDRFRRYADGKQEWGPGSATRDTNLYRDAVDSLRTDDSLTVGGALKQLGWSTFRRRELPDQLIADSLYAGSAPTIGTAQTTTPTAGYIKFAPAGVALTGSDVTGPFTYAGADGFAIGVGSPDSSYVLPLSKYPNTYASGQSTWSVEFGTDTQTFQVRFKHINSATQFRLSIDGRKVSDLTVSAGGITPGSGHLITIDLGSAAVRRIRLDFATFPFGGVYLPPTATMWSVALDGGRFMTFTDSIGDGSSQNTGSGLGTWVDRLGRLFGSTDVWRQGRGGTGYITAGSYATFGVRAPLDVIAKNPNRLVIMGGYNDNAGSQPAIGAAADSLFAAIKTGLPNCEVHVIGCWSPTATPGSTITNTDNTLRTSAATAGYPFISPVTGACYNAAGTLVATHGAWITAANVSAYIGGDAIHPTDAGHIYLTRRIYHAIKELMPA